MILVTTRPTVRSGVVARSCFFQKRGLLGVNQCPYRLGQGGLISQGRIGVNQLDCLLARLTDQVLVAEQLQELQAGSAAGLRRAENVALPSLLQVDAG